MIFHALYDIDNFHQHLPRERTERDCDHDNPTISPITRGPALVLAGAGMSQSCSGFLLIGMDQGEYVPTILAQDRGDIEGGAADWENVTSFGSKFLTVPTCWRQHCWLIRYKRALILDREGSALESASNLQKLGHYKGCDIIRSSP
jgi:hypothetical protein